MTFLNVSVIINIIAIFVDNKRYFKLKDKDGAKDKRITFFNVSVIINIIANFVDNKHYFRADNKDNVKQRAVADK